MTTAHTLLQEAKEELANHPAMKAANAAIVLNAVRYGTNGYQGESLNTFLESYTSRLLQSYEDAVVPERATERNMARLSSDFTLTSVEEVAVWNDCRSHTLARSKAFRLEDK